VQTGLQATIPADGKGPLEFDFALQDSTTAPRPNSPSTNFQET
jgi:hypothetical protein